MKPGDYVYYAPAQGVKENGRIKSIHGKIAFVVYKCADEWEHYMDYTGQSTRLEDLKSGWVDEKGNLLPEYSIIN